MALKVETLCWRDGALELIDQRALPIDVQYERCTSAAATAEAIRNMVVRGTPAIGCTAAYGLAVEALRLRRLAPPEFLAQMDQAAALLAATRPTAVNLFWAIDRMRRRLRTRTIGPPRRDRRDVLLEREARAIHDEDIAANRALGAHGAALHRRRRDRAHALQRGSAGHGGLRHGARRDSRRRRSGQAGQRLRRRDPAVAAGRAPHRVGAASRTASPSP